MWYCTRIYRIYKNVRYITSNNKVETNSLAFYLYLYLSIRASAKVIYKEEGKGYSYCCYFDKAYIKKNRSDVPKAEI